MSGSCLTPRTTVRTYPQAPCPPAMSESTDCKMYDGYTPCDDCPDYPNGYPAGKCLVVNVNGKCWTAVSMQNDNKSNPNNFIGNTDESKAWLVMEPCDYHKWLIKSETKSKQDALQDCGGKALAGGTKVPSCSDVCELLEKMDEKKQDQLLSCAGEALAGGTKVPSCNELADGLDEKQDKLKSCSGADLGESEVVACSEMGEGLEWDASAKKWVVSADCGPGYYCLPGGCGTILWGYAVITADNTIHKVDLPVALSAAVDPSQTSVTISDFGDTLRADGEDVNNTNAGLTSRQSSSNLSWTSMATDRNSSFGIYEVKATDDALPSKTVTWTMMTNRTCA